MSLELESSGLPERLHRLKRSPRLFSCALVKSSRQQGHRSPATRANRIRFESREGPIVMAPFRVLWVVVAISLVLASGIDTISQAAAPDFSRWSTGSGAWTDAGHWSNGVPSPFLRTEVHGVSHITIPSGTFIAGDLEVGLNPEDDTSVTLDGGELVLMQDSLRIGEETGGRAEFTMLGGAMHCPVDVCVGAANGVPGRGTHASLRIRGGSFLARDLLTGIGWGAQCCLSIEGSHASAIHLLDYCYFQ